ncbi:aspartate aminotransferase family protein [Sphaerisporangium album]|uniref:Adenosylmethionine-8-amino-7-oxononanoate aminotransferase n=1 Tax=Sphaerisporangium album TaxID=509200 RepID=A0A367FJS9_9ACTN|nr:aspartate aminotransferase family protein [Sphaerisporangium album]RCG30149.1 aspartate aminotransferase family protein [Sphaerisporangium album]
MDAETLRELDRRHLWHPYAPAYPATAAHPVAGAEGVRLRLADGRELVDGMSSWWAAIHGHNHPALNAAARDQVGVMAHVMFGGLTHEPAVRVARRLAEMTGLERVFLADSGSVAVEVAIKIAIQCTGKSRLLTVRGGYHGDTFGAMAVCDPVNGMHHMFTGVLPQHVFADRPPGGYGHHPGRAGGARPSRPGAPAEPLGTHDGTFVPREPSATSAAVAGGPPDEAYMDHLAEVVARHAGELAAIIVEPVVQGAGGMRFYHPAYLARLRELADEHGLLLIADEIATGFGRTGELFGCDHAGVRPDIMCVGKALTGGYLTMAATLCTREVAERVGVLMHGPTFMGNPLAAAVADASLTLLGERPWRQEVARIERGLVDGLAEAARAPGVKDVRVLGAIGVIETNAPVDVPKIQDIVMEHGVWLRPFGHLVYTMPPYVTGSEELGMITRAMVAAANALPA